MNNRLPDTSCRAILVIRRWQWPQCKWHVMEKSCSDVRWLQSCLRVWHTQFHIYILWQKTTWIFLVICRISRESCQSPWVLFSLWHSTMWYLGCSVPELLYAFLSQGFDQWASMNILSLWAQGRAPCSSMISEHRDFWKRGSHLVMDPSPDSQGRIWNSLLARAGWWVIANLR